MPDKKTRNEKASGLSKWAKLAIQKPSRVEKTACFCMAQEVFIRTRGCRTRVTWPSVTIKSDKNVEKVRVVRTDRCGVCNKKWWGNFSNEPEHEKNFDEGQKLTRKQIMF